MAIDKSNENVRYTTTKSITGRVKIASYLSPEINAVQEQAAIETIQQSDPTDFQAISASKLTLSNSFYNNALRQSQQSFFWSLIWAGVGAVFIILTVPWSLFYNPLSLHLSS